MKLKSICKAIAAVPLALALTAGSAHAAASLSSAFISGFQQLSDDSGEILIDYNGNGLVDVGDILVGMIQFTSFPTSGVNASTVNQMTAFYAVQATSVTAIPAAACGNALLTTCSAFTFSAASVGLDAILASLGLTTQGYGAAGTSTTAYVYEDTVSTLVTRDDTSQSITDILADATDGTLRLVIADVLANGDSFTTTGPQKISQLSLIPAGQAGGIISLDQTITDQFFPDLVFDEQIAGNGSFVGLKPEATNWPIADDTSFTVTVTTVPEPGSLALAGLGLLGLGAFRRRKSA